jgi:small subunit ribosomal protein S19e
MTTVTDVPATELISNVAAKLAEMKDIEPPDWAAFAKAGVHKEKAPGPRDWWYTRTASILRKVSIKAPIGVSKMGGLYGGPADRGSKPNAARKGSRSIIRKALMQLEAAGLVKTEKGRGRELTPAGQKLLDRSAHEVLLEMVKQDPQMGKY